MKGGPRRNKPAALRALHGSKTRPRHGKEPSFAPMSVEAPSTLTEIERAFWSYYQPILSAGNVLTAGDRDTLRRYCEALAEIDDIRAQQRAPEYRRVMVTVTIDSAGNEKVRAETNPLDAQLRNWVQIARLCASDLGLTPASRARVATVGNDATQDASPLARLRAQTRGLHAVN